MEFTHEQLADNGQLACILPCNFWKKSTKQFLKLHDKFKLVAEYDNKFKFANTGAMTKFFVFNKI